MPSNQLQDIHFLYVIMSQDKKYFFIAVDLNNSALVSCEIRCDLYLYNWSLGGVPVRRGRTTGAASSHRCHTGGSAQSGHLLPTSRYDRLTSSRQPVQRG